MQVVMLNTAAPRRSDAMSRVRAMTTQTSYSKGFIFERLPAPDLGGAVNLWH
jgi:hypothetical protein